MEFTNSSNESIYVKVLFKILPIVFIVILLAISGYLVFTLEEEEMVNTIQNLGLLAPLALIVFKIIVVVWAPLSGAILYPLSGQLFGIYLGTIIVIIGDTIGGLIAFMLARKFGKKIVVKLLGKEDFKDIEDGLSNSTHSWLDKLLINVLGKKIGSKLSNKLSKFFGDWLLTWKGLIVARIIGSTLLVNDFLSYFFGFTKVKIWQFIVVTALVPLIPTFFIVALGSRLFEVAYVFVLFFAIVAIISLIFSTLKPNKEK